MKILITGVAGFIGSHVAARLLAEGTSVAGLDNLSAYNDAGLKLGRLTRLHDYDGFDFLQVDITDRGSMESLFLREDFDLVIHLAGQPGVRHSLDNPHACADISVAGFLHVLEGCRRSRVGHLIYGSSASVYGNNSNAPYSVNDAVDHPVSLYAAGQKSNELMAHSYTHLFGIPTTGLRFFTVYGPWTRSDTAAYGFAQAILAGEPIDIYNYGRMKRDFVYIDDVVEAVVRLVHLPSSGYRLFNVGSGKSVSLLEFVSELESALGKRARKRFLPTQPGDVLSTWADAEDLYRHIHYRPTTPLQEGLQRFASWFLSYGSENRAPLAAQASACAG